MRLTHFGHACLLVEFGTTRLLLDPGVYSAGFDTLTGLSAVLLTHQHPDHVDVDRLALVLEANPGARTLADEDTTALLTEALGREVAMPFNGGESVEVGPVRIEGVGARHAFNHDQVPAPANTGYVLSADTEPTLFHPGDAFDGEPSRQVDVLALPLNAPWCAVRDSLAFATRLAPTWIVPIHDSLLNDTGRGGYLMHIRNFGPAGSTVQDLTGQPSWDVPSR